MDENELIQNLFNRLESISKHVSDEKGTLDINSWDMELDSIKSDMQMLIRRSFGESDSYIQKLNGIHIHFPFSLPGSDPRQSYYPGIGQMLNLLISLKRELEIYGKQPSVESQSSGPALIVMNPGSRLALRDYIDHPVTVNAYVTAMIQAVTESDIPDADKSKLLEQLSRLLTNPYVSGAATGLSSSLVASYLWKALGLG
jgi:hypothetical protein